MSVLFRFNGQAGYEVDTGRLKKIRVVFGMIDEDKTSMAWYLFSSDGDAKAKSAISNKTPPVQFGHRDEGGRDIPHTFKNEIGLEGLAIHPKGTTATLTLVISGDKHFIECRIDKLTTKSKEVVTFPFAIQYDSDPPKTGKIDGKVRFLDTAAFDRKAFPQGPQGATAQHAIFQ